MVTQHSITAAFSSPSQGSFIKHVSAAEVTKEAEFHTVSSIIAGARAVGAFYFAKLLPIFLHTLAI